MRNTPLCVLNSVPFQNSTRTTLLVEFTYWVLSNKWIHLQFPSLTGYTSYFALIFALFKMISTLNGGMNNDRVYFFLDSESDNTIFFTYCFSSNFLNLNMFCSFPKQLLMEFFSRYTVYQSPNLFHLDICKLNTTRSNNKKSCDTLFTICLTIKI